MATNDSNNHLIINLNLAFIDRLLVATGDDLFTGCESNRAKVTEGKEARRYLLITVDGRQT